ncbi:hypothetical protein BpJC7_20020 [Weizmannia acidilactici]|uniref:Uncharacterized protein n=1 Tax=Weizmannia acidilactici TaxID=2607726 RepID=A0A5J4JHD9_9BACI|nr:hypothetical protein [Weizmannia acidilactici]GER68008.1 hypothetical protein BpJC4_24790 [Weizmannia acidilactici]GER70699.1 hypothetical protein BpJC7_20020 [Weizmannia acidilactici]GER74192.1 hypothetical protein BpPP18_22590 [Weizmannia acidilactici]
MKKYFVIFGIVSVLFASSFVKLESTALHTKKVAYEAEPRVLVVKSPTALALSAKPNYEAEPRVL